MVRPARCPRRARCSRILTSTLSTTTRLHSPPDQHDERRWSSLRRCACIARRKRRRPASGGCRARRPQAPRRSKPTRPACRPNTRLAPENAPNIPDTRLRTHRRRATAASPSSSGTGAGRITRALVGSWTWVCAQDCALAVPGGHRLLLRVPAAVWPAWCAPRPIRASRPAVDMPASWAERNSGWPLTPTAHATFGRTRRGRCSVTTRWRRSRRGRRGRPRV